MGIVLHLCDLLPQTANPILIIRQQQINLNTRTCYKNPNQSILKTVKVIRIKESLSKYHSQGQPQETGQVNVMWYLDGVLGKVEGHLVKAEEI